MVELTLLVAEGERERERERERKMLTCIACSKQLDDSGDDGARGTPSTKDAVKSLTTQVRIAALLPDMSVSQCFSFFLYYQFLLLLVHILSLHLPHPHLLKRIRRRDHLLILVFFFPNSKAFAFLSFLAFENSNQVS